jgi:hypothetical protein
MPSGPPPEYEDPPKPSWLDAGGARAPSAEPAVAPVAPIADGGATDP